jgi:RNA polymerase-binding transcription factor DksA
MESQMAQMKLELDAMKAQAQMAIQSDNQDLKEEQFKFKQFIDSGELEILKTAEDLRGIASPTG